jgi:hypothetical protein
VTPFTERRILKSEKKLIHVLVISKAKSEPSTRWSGYVFTKRRRQVVLIDAAQTRTEDVAGVSVGVLRDA